MVALAVVCGLASGIYVIIAGARNANAFAGALFGVPLMVLFGLLVAYYLADYVLDLGGWSEFIWEDNLPPYAKQGFAVPLFYVEALFMAKVFWIVVAAGALVLLWRLIQDPPSEHAQTGNQSTPEAQAEQKTPRQQSCNEYAAEHGLKGEDKKTFLSSCIKD